MTDENTTVRTGPESDRVGGGVVAGSERAPLPTLFEWVGGMPVLNALTRRFYHTYATQDPVLGELFAHIDDDHYEHVAAWLAEVFGGPTVYTDKYGGFNRMMSRHLGRGFTEEQRARFVALLIKSADDIVVPSDPEFRAAFVAYLEWGSRIAVETSQPGANPPPNMQMPLWGWIRDAVPGARPSSFERHESRPELVIPGPAETVSFADHIKPQFRRMDQHAMSYLLDLWNVQDVSYHGPKILARLEDHTMPVDGPWPEEAIALFRRWLDTGMHE